MSTDIGSYYAAKAAKADACRAEVRHYERQRGLRGLHPSEEQALARLRRELELAQYVGD